MAAGVLSATAPGGPRPQPIAFGQTAAPASDTLLSRDTVVRKKRPRAIEYSDAYYTRLRIHQIASYAELPMMGAEWILGQRLIDQRRTGIESDGLKAAHTTVALGLGALFTINTVTGGWNLWESRHDPNGRTLRIIHSVAMLGADAGFAWAGASAPDDDEGQVQGQFDASHHRNIAISSIALATAGTVMMWLFHD